MWTSAQLRPRRQLELEQVIVEEEEEEELELEQVIVATRRSPTHISPKHTLTISETLMEGNLSAGKSIASIEDFQWKS